jgi:hypothetical protein
MHTTHNHPRLACFLAADAEACQAPAVNGANTTYPVLC